MLDCHRREEVRFVGTNLCSIVTEVKKYDLLSPICACILTEGKKYDLLLAIGVRLSQKGRSTICCHQFVLVRFVATNLCSIIIRQEEGFVAHQFVLDYHRRQEVRFVAAIFARRRREEVRFVVTNFCSIVTEGKKGRSTICCHQIVLDCHRKEKYDLLPAICAPLSQKGRNTMSCHFFCSSQKGRSTICCQKFRFDYHRREEVRCVATNLCSIVTEGRSMICCHQFALDCNRREEV